MRLTVLGSGTCVPSLRRNAPGYLLEINGRQILIDCGSGTILQLLKAGKGYEEIDAVFLTHTHPDHVSDLIPLIHALLATPGLVRSKDLLIVGPSGTRTFFKTCILSLLRYPDSFRTNLVEIEDRLDLGFVHVISAHTAHSANSVAYRFENGGRSVVITGDTDYDDKVVQLSRETDLLVADCSFPDSLKMPGHMTPGECGLMARRAKAKRLLLSHLYPSTSPDTDRLKECRSVFDGDLLLAEDLMVIDI
jgi:ribonuclease BN (tRNA processing enzyme)